MLTPSSLARSSIPAALLAAGLLANTSCATDVERSAHADHAPEAPHVTVANPVQATVSDASEYTGRAEAVDSVEVRARATGYLQRVAFNEGDLVKKGDLLFVVDPRQATAGLKRSRAELERARADHGLATRDAARAVALLASKVIPEREWDSQSSALAQQKARTDSEAAAVDLAELDLDYCFVRAPVAGRIGRILVTVGNLVGPSLESPLATVVSVDPLYVYVDVDESHALHLGRAVVQGQRAASVAFGDEAGHPHPATIDFLDNRIDPATGTQKVRVVVKNGDGRLTAGLFARVSIPEGEAHPALLVSDRAVGTDQDRRLVLVVDAASKVQYRPVKLGPLHDGLRIVREGLTPDDRVIVSGLQRVHAGVQVVAETNAVLAPDAGASSRTP